MLYSWFINELDLLNLFSVGRDGIFQLSYCLIVLFIAYLQKNQSSYRAANKMTNADTLKLEIAQI